MERELIETGEAYDLLKEIISLVEKRFFDVSGSGGQTGYKWKCVKRISSIVINFNLAFLLAVKEQSQITSISHNFIAYQ